MVERDDHQTIAGFFCETIPRRGEALTLPADVSHHAHVRRVRAGTTVRLFDGRGRVATATTEDAKPKSLTVRVDDVQEWRRPTALEVVVPVADRDRMLMAAEKCVELQVTTWRPAYFARSHSVTSRGEGERFREKVRARMVAALEQSGGGWLPEVHEERDLHEVLEAIAPTTVRLLLDADGAPIRDLVEAGPIAIAVGPEGGMETRELAEAARLGWLPASLGATTLRFETAIIAGGAIIRALQYSTGSK
jgi:16S rRNA (uracil1498-N3)-methyltransferase